MRSLACLFVFLATSLPLSAVEQERVWTNAEGRTMRAQFLREVDGEAVFLKDGKPVTIPLDQLSEPDRQYIRGLASANQAEGNEDAAAANPFQPVTRPSDSGEAFPQTGGNLPSLAKKRTPILNRDWTNLDGNRTNGKFVRVYDRNVLIMRGLRTVDLPFDTLSFEDQSYVNQILTERGERPLPPIPVNRGADYSGGGPGAFAPGQGPPFTAEPHSANQGPPAQPGGSQFFEELRRKQEERRQEQAQHLAEMAAAARQVAKDPTHQPPSATDSAIAAAPADSATSGAAAPTAPAASSGLVIDAKTLAELRPVLIVGVVVIGLFAIVGVIVFIATTIANGNRRQRRYS